MNPRKKEEDMRRKKAKLGNCFHNTETTILLPADGCPEVLSTRRVRAIRDRLCGSRDCTCGDVLGARGGPEEIYYREIDDPRGAVMAWIVLPEGD